MYNKTIQIIEKEKSLEYYDVMQKNCVNIEYILSDIKSSIVNLSSEPGIVKAMELYQSMELVNKNNFKGYVDKKLLELTQKHNYINNTILVDKVNNQIYFSDKEISINIEEFFNNKSYKEFIASDNDIIWAYSDTTPLFNNINNKKVFLAIHKIWDSKKMNIQGYIIVVINSKSFEEIYTNTFLEDIGDIRLVDNKNNILIRDSEFIDNKKLSQISAQFLNNSLMKKIKLSGNSNRIAIIPVQNFEFKLLGVIPEAKFIESTKKSLYRGSWLTVVISFIFYLCVIVGIAFIHKLMRDKDMAYYRLTITEELNTKLRLYKHDFANHLQIINGLIELNRSEKAREYLKKVAGDGFIISDKYEIGIPELESAIITSIYDAEKYNIDVVIDAIVLDKKISNKVYDLSKILSNLIRNAMFALKEDEGNDKRLIIKIYEENNKYIFEIINNKPLIHKELEEKIFTKGFSTKGDKGSGLGLYIARNLAQKNGGSVVLRVDDLGNHFIVTIPIIK
jgi:sensor histidine kinase YesM